MKKEDREKISRKMIYTREAAEDPQAGSYEHITDTAPQGIEWEGLPAGIQDQIENAIADFCLYECKPPVADLAKERAPRWAACCIYVGHNVFKRFKILTLGENPRRGDGTRKPYDVNIINAAIPLWCFFCSRYDKPPLITDFFNFVGASDQYYYAAIYGKVTPPYIEISKKLKLIQEAGLAGLISDGRGNPTGAIAILNHWHGWAQAPAQQEKTAVSVISAASLPRLGGDQPENGTEDGN
jgi:hypothetical protein